MFRRLLIFLIVVGLLLGVGFFVYYNFFNNGNLNGGQSIDGRYSNIKISVPDFTKKSSFPDVYVLSLNFKNLPPEQNAHEVTTYLWNKDRGVVKFVDRRTLSMDKSEITLLINFPVTIGKEELRNSDSIKVDIADGVNGNRKIVFTKLLDFDPNYYLGGTKNEVSIKIKEQNWVFDRVYTLKDFEDKLTETAGLEPQKGVIFLGETVDYYGFYVRKTKTSFDFIFLDDAFNVVDLNSEVLPTNKDNISPYIEARSQSKAVMAINGGIIKEYQIRVGDIFLLLE